MRAVGEIIGVSVHGDRVALDGGALRRDQGYSLHVTALPDVHQALLTAAAALGTDQASPALYRASDSEAMLSMPG
ncbi:hypothetical protein FNH05_18715 [Amycolatopsis rhizosphaerae]|uniref:Uncharacterized protein n=1 Tax=Amycolatopsis rhizosphaerae TaxID=2053003 RepID=A0A558CFZ3_9PSEU|nr:hypothetical protein [Amycolatopsis rhizosphaerae]TVT47686.1 hypothetical protein FNH05_18715 [Amycolatopsis rhizosphaerae]